MTRQAVQTLDCSLTRRTEGIVPVVVASSIPHDRTGIPFWPMGERKLRPNGRTQVTAALAGARASQV